MMKITIYPVFQQLSTKDVSAYDDPTVDALSTSAAFVSLQLINNKLYWKIHYGNPYKENLSNSIEYSGDSKYIEESGHFIAQFIYDTYSTLERNVASSLSMKLKHPKSTTQTEFNW